VELNDRSVLVTGGARRVGRAIALEFARHGARVGIHYATSIEAAGETAAAIGALGAEAATFAADLTEPGEIDVLATAVAERFQGLDVLVHSAADYGRTPFGAIDAAACDRFYRLNQRAPLLLTQALAPALRAGGGGRVVLIADISAGRPWPAYLPYGVTKAAVVHLTRGLAKALAPEVLVNAVAPGTVLPPADSTDAFLESERQRTLTGRLGTPEDVARAVVFLAASDFTTGQVLAVDGGKSLR